LSGLAGAKIVSAEGWFVSKENPVEMREKSLSDSRIALEFMEARD
jgi:hypothetical protein